MAFHRYLAYVVAKTKDQTITLLSRRISARSKEVKIGDQIFYVDLPFDPELSVKSMLPQREDHGLKSAKKLNKMAMFVFAIVYLVCNVIFWISAISEYIRPAEHYL